MVKQDLRSTLERVKQLKWGKLFNMMYIEPIVFALVFAHSLSGTIMRNQVIYQACTAVFNYNESDCKQLGTKNITGHLSEIETEVQPYVANLFMIRTLLESIVPAFCGIFVGAWSDHYGRKPLLLISMIGFSCTYIIAAGICYMSNYYPVNPWWYILAAVPHSFLGGNCVFSVAAFCFISDITDTKTRPYRMIFMEAFFFIGLTGGSLLSSFVYAATNATITFLISGVLMCAATVFIAMYVPESLNFKLPADEQSAEPQVRCMDLQMRCDDLIEPPAEEKSTDADSDTEKGKYQEQAKQTEKEKHKVNETEKEQEETKKTEQEQKETKKTEQEQKEVKQTEQEKEKDSDSQKEKSDKEKDAKMATEKPEAGLFSYVHIKDMWDCCFKPRPHYDRCIIWLVTGTMFLSIFVLDGAMTVFYLFVREKFHWTIREFTLYETISHMITMFGAILGFLVLRKVFSMSVVMLAILAFLSDVLASMARGLAAEDWHLYLSVALGAFKSVGGPMCRTIVSNIVPSTDLGKIFSIKNVLQSFAPFLAAPLYTLIYNKSLTTFPGLFNIFSAALYLIALIFLIVVLRFKYIRREHYAKVLK